MEVLMLNGSPRVNGNTSIALAEMEKVFLKNGIETEIIQVGGMTVSGCKSCGYCFKNGKCAIDDIINNELADALATGNVNKYNKILKDNDIEEN